MGAPVPPAPGAASPMPGGPMPGAGGIPGAMGTPPMAAPTGPPDPASLHYLTETQQDGTVLLRVMNPDGSPGPVVQIVQPKAAKPGGKK